MKQLIDGRTLTFSGQISPRTDLELFLVGQIARARCRVISPPTN